MLRFFVHSTFRDPKGGQVLPTGLCWDMDGVSHMTYVPAKGTALDACQQPGLKRALVAAHNRWSFAKDLPFQNERDIFQMV